MRVVSVGVSGTLWAFVPCVLPQITPLPPKAAMVMLGVRLDNVRQAAQILFVIEFMAK